MLTVGHMGDAERRSAHCASLNRVGKRNLLGTWGSGNFENDAAMDFLDQEIDRHVAAIGAIFADSDRFHLDEDAEGELMPRVTILALLCGQCGGVFGLHNEPDVSAWKTRYLEMYDDQIDGLEPRGDYKEQRRAVIADAFDTLIRLQQHWRQRDEE
jgi:hypothetical protein